MNEIGERIKMIRSCLRLSQQEFSSRIGILPENLEKWEGGILPPSVDEILKVSRVYGVSTEFLINGIESPKDERLLNRKLSKSELKDEIRNFVVSKMESESTKSFIDKLCEIALLEEDVIARDASLEGKIYFKAEDLLAINNYDVYLQVSLAFSVNGAITFEMLNPNLHSLKFYEEALKDDEDNLEDTFLKYVGNRNLWNDEVLLWMIDHGAVCVEFVGIEPQTSTAYSCDGCPDSDTTYEPIYTENLVLTFLLKAELKREVEKRANNG